MKTDPMTKEARLELAMVIESVNLINLDMVKIEKFHQISSDIDAFHSQITQKPAASDLPSWDAGSTVPLQSLETLRC